MKKDHKSKTTDVLILDKINNIIKGYEKEKIIEPNDISDGHHTFGQLYDCRLAFNIVLFNEWVNPSFDVLGVKHNVHKSIRHHDGELCFGGGWFIVVAVLPTGQISFHYKMEDWDKFKIPEFDKAQYEFDGHTTEDVINRLIQL
jgi:hypothetical protein